MIPPNLIEEAAKEAESTVISSIVADLRKNPILLELEVRDGISETDLRRVEDLSVDFRYDILVTPYEGEGRKVVGNSHHKQVKRYIGEALETYGDHAKIEIWQGASEAHLKEMREAF